MDIKAVHENNVYEFSDYLDCDVAENIGRMYYNGIAGCDPDDDSLLSLLIWELKFVKNSDDAESELKWIYAADPSFIAPLLEDYHKEVQDGRVRRTYFECPPMEEAKETVLKNCGFSIKPVEGRDINVTVNEAAALPFAKKEAPSYIQSIVFLENQQFYQGLMNILFKYDNPALDDLAYLPMEWYEQSVSCYTKTDGKVTGLLLVHACASGVLVPVLFFSVGADSRMNLVEMMRFSIRQAAEIYPGDTIIRIHRRNKEVSALSAKLFPNRKGVDAVAGERAE